MSTYCILGEGNVGTTLGAYLASKNHIVKIFKGEKLDKDKINWEVNIEGSICDKGKISLITNNMSKAIEGADLVFITVPAFCRKKYLEDLLSEVRSETRIVFFPDNYGLWELNSMLETSDKKHLIKAVGTSSFIYPCRKIKDNLTQIKGIKKEIFTTSFDKEALHTLVPMLNDIWNVFKIRENYLEIQLLNMNPIIHPAVLLFNLGRVENQKGNFDFYSEGITKTIAEVIKKIDSERIEVGKAWGIDLVSLEEIMKTTYLSNKESLFESLAQSNVHRDGLAPSSLDTRYIKEDIPYGLAPISNLGKLKGVKTPVIDTIINLSNILLDEDYLNVIDVKNILPYI